MIIQCGKCKTRFKLADEKMKPQGVKVRCTHCDEVFAVFPKDSEASSAPPPPKPAPPPPPPEPAGESFDFSDVSFDEEEDQPGGQDDEFDIDEFNLEGVDDKQQTTTDSATVESASAATGVREVVPGDLPPLDDFNLDDDFDGFDGTPAEGPETEEEEEEPNIGGDLGVMFEDESPSEALPQLDDEVGIGPREFSFDDSPDQPFVAEADESSSGPVEFSFDDSAEEEPGTKSDEFVFEEETASFGADDDFASVDFDMPSAAPVESSVPIEEPPATMSPPASASTAPRSEPATRPYQRKRGRPAQKRRKKSNSRGALLMLLLLLTLGGAYAWYGWQLNTYDPALLIEHLRAKLPGLQQSEPQGSIEVRNLSSLFIDNQNAGQLFVINGEVVNRYPGDRSAISVKGVVYNAEGKAVLQQTVFCGNPLDEAALRTLPYSKIEESMNNQFGDALSNLNLSPNQAIPFTVVFRNLPTQISEFNVELADSRPGTK